MEEQKSGSLKTYVGMFDLAKGIGMIMVVLAHTISQYNINTLPSFPLAVFGIVGTGLLPMFFIVSGYGFRKQKIVFCIKQQIRYILLPYLYVTLGMAIIFPCIHIAFFKWPRGAFNEMVRVVLAFILGVCENSGIRIGPYELYDCGTVWFLLALMNGWIILNFIFVFKNIYIRNLFVFLSVIVGMFLCQFGVWFFCFQASLISVGYLYIGYLLKKYRILHRKLPFWVYCLLVIGVSIQFGFGKIVMSTNYWRLGVFDMILSFCNGFILIKLSLLGNVLTGTISQGIRTIGRYSLWIMCVHTLESICIPWYLFSAKFVTNPVIGILLQLILHCITIFGGCFLIKIYILVKKNLKIRRSIL